MQYKNIDKHTCKSPSFFWIPTPIPPQDSLAHTPPKKVPIDNINKPTVIDISLIKVSSFKVVYKRFFFFDFAKS